MSILGPLLRWLWRMYVDHLVCLHFCAFKRAGSTLKYTHVHILRSNPDGATGLGHDDETNRDHPAHASISDSGGCRTQAENDGSQRLRGPEFGSAYFHEAGPGGCGGEFTAIRCHCGEAETWVCYTMDHDVFERWYNEQKFPHRSGRYILKAVPAERLINAGTPRRVDCGSSLIIEAFDIAAAPSNCAGFGAPDSNNQLVVNARHKLQQALDQISCNGTCPKSYSETFCGWRCYEDHPGFYLADALVQWTVRCG